jgi:hypothetical protein
MRERPIIFNREMVRAVMEGRKVQTRRAVKFPLRDKDLGCELSGNELAGEVSGGNYRNCPFGAVGDRLWVRETFSVVPRTAYAASEGVQQVIRPDDNHDAAIFRSGWEHSSVGIRWRPSIHMPRWASRITLEITGVRVERLTALSDDDARNEGCPAQLPHNPEDQHQARTWFRGLWSEIYGEESWQANPWVWVIEFKRVEGE